MIDNLLYVLVPGIIVLITNIIQLIVQYFELKKVRKELEGTSAIIKDTTDLRIALQHKLEGIWTLTGKFDKHQGDLNNYYSKGFLILTWNSNIEAYDAIYCYSVYKAYSSEAHITTICHGNSCNDSNGDKDNYLTISFSIVSRTAQVQTNSQNFNLILHIPAQSKKARVQILNSEFSSPNTSGKLTFQRIS